MMVFRFLAVCVFLAAPSLSIAQVTPEPICGTPIVSDPSLIEKAWRNTLARYPGLQEQVRQELLRKASLELVLGVVDTFWVYNFVSTQFDRVPAELRAIGTRSYVWVSLEELQNQHVDSLVVGEIEEALESRTPPASRDSTQGIVELGRQFFGNPPNVDQSWVKGTGDGRTHFLLCDIKDGWSPGESYVAGFFFSIDVDPSSNFSENSNRRDMLYIDTYPGVFLNDVRTTGRVLGTVAHEFQHLIHWNYDPREIEFFNEGLSEYASYVCGYGLRSPGGYFANPNVPLLEWASTIADYSRSALWTLYLAEQFGDAFIRNFTQDPNRSTAGFQSSMMTMGLDRSLSRTVTDFHVANFVQDRSAGVAYGYDDSQAFAGRPRLLKNTFGSTASGSRSGLRPMAADYMRFFAAETLRTTISPTAGTLLMSGVQYRDDQTTVVDVAASSSFESVFASSARSELLLVITNSSTIGDAGYTYTAEGAPRESAVLELLNDDGVSQYPPYAFFNPNDTAFVVFEGVDGGKVDSVALWFQSTGIVRLLLRDANPNYDLGTSPLRGLGGAPRMSGQPVSLTVTDTGFMKTVVDLRSRNISSSPDFVVQVIYDATAPNPLLRRDTSQSVLRSFLSLQAQPTPGRIMYASFGDFYVRAFLSPGTPPPLVVLPDRFVLFQNYPNPFNASTIVSYDLPERTRVRLSVFDLLGREVAVLKDAEEDADRYLVEFDGSRLASGVYFYRLKTPAFSQTKKMILIR